MTCDTKRQVSLIIMTKEHLTPTQTGDRLALKHGAYSPASVNPIAYQLAADVLERRPDLLRYPEALERWADLEAKVRLLSTFVDEKGFFAGARPTAAINLFIKLENSARRARQELGLSPLAEVQLEKLKRETVAVDQSLDELRERGRQAMNNR